jgi:glycosyltransferase involved in cell wall biosynthesis
MARILWLSDGGSTTGFARVTHAIGDRLVRDYGHDIHCLAVNYTGDHWDTPIKLYLPNQKMQQDVYGQTRFVEMLARVLPDITVFVNDPYVVMKFLLRNKHDEQLLLARTRPVLAYMPVDGINLPQNWNRLPDIIASLPPVEESDTSPILHRIAMTKFGQAALPGSHLVYHGVDSDVFHPVSYKNPISSSTGMVVTTKGEAKAMLDVPDDAFLITRVDRNSHRKNYGDTWRAVVPLMKKYNDIYVWFHCKAEGDSLELPQVLSREPEIADRFRWPGMFDTRHGWANDDLAIVYNATDLFVSTSWGEGFGLGLAEALACEVPVVAQNCSSIPEVVGPGGVLIEPERLIMVDSGEDQWLPNVPAFTDAIERLYHSRGARRSYGQAGREHVISNFNWDEATYQFDSIINGIVTAPKREQADAVLVGG